MPDALKAALADRYRIESEIGSGGMATVYLAQDLKHDRKVAVKVLKPELAAVIGTDRFLREIEIAASLHHPHILPLYDSGKDADFLYFVMPYEEGRSIRERLVKEGELPVQDAVRLLRDVADALAHAHEQGVVHRDIKPDNVLLSGRHALVTDFGVAKAISEATGRHQLTTTGVALGTPAYMAPEQASGEDYVDHRADIYAFGALAYELLTGQPPFTGPSSQAVLAAHVTEAPKPVTEGRASAPPALESLIMRCLEKKPADRWQSAEEMLPHLEAMATPSGGMQPTTAGTALGVGTKARRTPVWATLVAVVGIMVAVVMFLPRGSESTVIPSAAKIAILPLAPTVEDSALTRLGRDLVVLISSNLDGVGPINTVDPNVILVRTQDVGRPFTLEEGIGLAREFGAGGVLHGNLVRVGGDVRIRAELVRTEDHATVARIAAQGNEEDAAFLADTTTWDLLSEVWRGEDAPTPHLASGITSSFEALRAYLDGEKAHREGRYQRAWEAYERAFTVDSSLWLAYWRYDQARSWMALSVDAWITEAYQDHLDQFPKLDREYFDAIRGTTGSARVAALREFAEQHPDHYPGWWRYGDRIIHGGILHGESLSAVTRSFERVVELNPLMINAWEHLAFCYLIEGDLERADLAVEELAQRGGREALMDGYGYDAVALFRNYIDVQRGELDREQGADTLFRVLKDARRVNDFLLPVLARYYLILGEAGIQIGANRRLMEDPGIYQLADLHQSQAIAWASRGAWDSAVVELEEVSRLTGVSGGTTPPYPTAVVGVLQGGLGPEAAIQLRAPLDPNALPLSDRARLFWYDGIFAYATEDLEGLSAARLSLEAMDTTATELFERSLDAFAYELRGDREEARQRLLGLEEARADSDLGWGSQLVFSVHRRELPQWLREAGDPQLALRFLEWQKSMFNTIPRIEAGVLVGALSRLEMARGWEDLGRTQEALKWYRDFLRRYDMPPPQHQHLIEEAQTAIGRLGRGSS